MNTKCTIVPDKPAIIGFQIHPFTIIEPRARAQLRDIASDLGLTAQFPFL